MFKVPFILLFPQFGGADVVRLYVKYKPYAHENGQPCLTGSPEGGVFAHALKHHVLYLYHTAVAAQRKRA